MAVNNYYSSNFGYFTVVADSGLYDIIRSTIDVSTYFPFAEIYGTCAVNTAEVDQDVLLTISEMLSNVRFVEIEETSETPVSRTYTVDGNKKIVNTSRIFETAADLRFLSQFKLGDTFFSFGNNDLPYGYLGSRTAGGTTANFLDFRVLLSNAEMNQFKICGITIYKDRDEMVQVEYHYDGGLNEDQIAFLTEYFDGLVPEDISDPYNGGGTSGTGGGTGSFDGSSDPINFPSTPSLSAVGTGFITLFNPTINQLINLASYMWSDLFDLNTFRKIFADPMDCILGLSIVPVAVPDGGAAPVKVGNISTGVMMTKASSQYVVVDCGTLNVNEYWGAYLDYEPFTKAEIYLPYCGTHPIAVDDIMGKAVHVQYNVDILSGACIAMVKCGDSIKYSFIGQCSSSIPVTGNDWTNVINGILTISASVGSMVATGGASAPLVMPGVAQTAVNNMKPSVEKSGALGGTGGMLGVQSPYLMLTRPRQAKPKNQNQYTGYPSFITKKLKNVSGYTEIESIHLDGVYATDSELKEIEQLLKSGVIL